LRLSLGGGRVCKLPWLSAQGEARQVRLSAIAGAVGATVYRDGAIQNLGFVPDTQPALLVFAETARFARILVQKSNVAAVLTTPDLADGIPAGLALGVCPDPRLAFAEIHNRLVDDGFYWDDFVTSVDPSAEVHPSAWVAPSNVRIGRNCVVGPHATILARCLLGESVAVGAGAILGGVGMQTVRSARPLLEMRHAGGLIIRDGVQILPGAIIATGVFRPPTEIGAEARIGSRAFVSHAVRVGARSSIGHGAVVNGNVLIGEEAWIGPGAIVTNNIEIGEKAFVSLGAVVVRDVPAGWRMSGNFAIKHRQLLRLQAAAEFAGGPEEGAASKPVRRPGN
jgi:UDP-3-O-[3-hydroxymyristoyl] glucosamine N-acyltransferase